MTTIKAMEFLLSFEDKIISDRLEIAENGIRVLRWRLRHNEFSPIQMHNYLKKFGFPLVQDWDWGTPQKLNNGKKKIQRKNS